MSQPNSEGEVFSQKGDNTEQVKDKKTYDKNYWKTKQLFMCIKEGHTASTRIKGNNKYLKKKEHRRSGDNNSRGY